MSVISRGDSVGRRKMHKINGVDLVYAKVRKKLVNENRLLCFVHFIDSQHHFG